MVVVSVTPEIALEEINCYAGGLGVLEGDKFIEASKNGFKYFVLTLLYKKGYVDYYITDDGNIIAKPQKHPIDLTKFMKAEEEFVIKIRGENVYTRPWIYTKGRAKVVFFEATCPLWLRQATERVYIEKDEESRIYKWIFLAKASAKYIKEFIGLDSVDVIDLNEAYASLLVYALPEYKNFRLIV
ncbi:MAG: glycosyl transferase family 1, partial [Ignisphaera sp.]